MSCYYTYNTNNSSLTTFLNLPIIRHFLIVDNSSVTIFTYTGRLHLTPRYSGLSAQLNMLTEKYISLGLHYVAIRDCTDESGLYTTG